MTDKRYPLPPFTLETAKEKVQLAENAGNTNDAEKVSKSSTIDTEWRNRSTFLNGRQNVADFLNQKWKKELEYKRKKELWCLLKTKLAFGLNTNGMMKRGSGLEVMVMKCRSLMKMA